MTATGRAALSFGPGKPMELAELPVPDPEGGAVVVRVTRANICGSDLHIWRSDGYLSATAQPDGRIIGHEMTGSCTPSAPTDWAGNRLAEGDRVAYQGAGGLGVYATAVARDKGAETVIVIDGVVERLDLAPPHGRPPRHRHPGGDHRRRPGGGGEGSHQRVGRRCGV